MIPDKDGNKRYYDFAPRNQSFIRTAMELKQLGVKNYYFMLETKNVFANVDNIDPFKKNITSTEIESLMLEMKQNLWFYARTVARIRSDAGVVNFELHRGLAATLWCFLNGIDCCLCEPRQTYKTTGTLTTAIAWAFQIASQNTRIKFFGKESANTKKNLSDLRDDIDLLPEWLQFKRYNDPQDGKVKKTRQAAETLENKLFHNRVTITPKPTSETHAQGMARGESGAIMYFDEIEHMAFFPVVLANSSPAFKTAADNARSVGNPAGRIFTTTPGNLDTKEGREAMPVIRSMVPWTEKMYDMSNTEMDNYVSTYREEYHANDELKKDNREVVKIFYIEYQYYQLRKTHQWVEEQFALSGDRMAIRREIFLQRLRGSSSSPVSAEDIEFLIQNMKKATSDILLNGKWRMLLYAHGVTKNPTMISPDKYNLFDDRIPYLVSVDPAGGGGGDNTAIKVINPYNLQIAAEFKSPYISGTELLRCLVDLVINYIPRAVVIPEKNSMGIYLIHNLCESSIRDNLYWSQSARELEELTSDDPDQELKRMSEQYKKYGVYTSVKVRAAMFELLFKHLRECKQLLNTEYLVDDICKLTRTSTGKIEAGKGEHDDNLMAYLIAMYIYYTGDNLEFFGINKAEHPVIGVLEPDYEQNMESKDMGSGIFSTEGITFDTITRDAIIEDEQLTKYLISTNPDLYYDPVYSRMRDDPTEETSILPYFFDSVNDLGGN